MFPFIQVPKSFNSKTETGACLINNLSGKSSLFWTFLGDFLSLFLLFGLLLAAAASLSLSKFIPSIDRLKWSPALQKSELLQQVQSSFFCFCFNFFLSGACIIKRITESFLHINGKNEQFYEAVL